MFVFKTRKSTFLVRFCDIFIKSHWIKARSRHFRVSLLQSEHTVMLFCQHVNTKSVSANI